MLFSGIAFFDLLLIIYTTYAYQYVLVIVVFTMTVISVLIAQKKSKQLTAFHLIIDEKGICSFEPLLDKTLGGTANTNELFQLLISSRYSFLGCWLDMYSSKSLTSSINKKHKKKQLFIYRDSLSQEDFSRLSQIIRELKRQA